MKTMGLILCVLVAFAAAPRRPAESIPSLVGTWRLVSAESRSADGQIQPQFGANPLGVLMYDSAGRMSVHLMRRDRPAFASGDMRRGTPEELESAFDSYLSYYGTYEVDPAAGTVSHQLEGCSFPNWTGTIQKRWLKFEDEGKRLSLSTPPIPMDGKESRIFLIWERLD